MKIQGLVLCQIFVLCHVSYIQIDLGKYMILLVEHVALVSRGVIIRIGVKELFFHTDGSCLHQYSLYSSIGWFATYSKT